MPLWGFNRWVAVNTGTRTAYGSWGTPDSGFNVTSVAWSRTIERQDESDEFTGYEEDTSSGTGRLLAVSIQGDIAGRATPHAIATFGAMALGSHSSGTAGTLGTSATAYRHSIRPLKLVAGTASTGTLPAITVTESPSGTIGLQFDYQGCVASSFGLSCSRKGWVQYTASLVGSGVFRDSTFNRSSVVSEVLMKAGDAKIFIGTTSAATPSQNKSTSDITGTAYGTAIDFTVKLVDFNWTYNNNLLLDDGYEFNGGTTRGHLDKGRRTQTLTTTLELHDKTAQALLESQKLCALEIECYSELIESNAYYGFNLVFPHLVAESMDVQGGPGDKMTLAINWKVGEDTTKGSVMLDVYNTRTAYLQ